MEESILTSIKNLLGILDEDTSFDLELISLINGAISDLTQIAVGPDAGFMITGYTETWNDFVSNVAMMSSAKLYIFCKVRLLFDAPTNSFICDAFTKNRDEAYWRLYIMADRKEV